MKELRNRQLPSQTTVEPQNSEENIIEPSEGEEVQVLTQDKESRYEMSGQCVQKEETGEFMKCMTLMQQQMNVMQKMIHTMMPQSQMHHDNFIT
jgi:hypothetical protein